MISKTIESPEFSSLESLRLYFRFMCLFPYSLRDGKAETFLCVNPYEIVLSWVAFLRSIVSPGIWRGLDQAHFHIKMFFQIHCQAQCFYFFSGPFAVAFVATAASLLELSMPVSFCVTFSSVVWIWSSSSVLICARCFCKASITFCVISSGMAAVMESHENWDEKVHVLPTYPFNPKRHVGDNMSLRIAVFSEQLYHMDMAAVEILLGKEFRKITQVSEFNFTLSRSFCSQSLLFCPSGLLILSATRKDLVHMLPLQEP